MRNKAGRRRQARRWFRRLIGPLRDVAWDHGYTLAVHGTIARDIDLVAVPWIEWATPTDALVEALAAEVGRCGADPRAVEYDRASRDHDRRQGGRPARPHGRRSFVFHLTYDFGDGPYVDLSVMPLAAK